MTTLAIITSFSNERCPPYNFMNEYMLSDIRRVVFYMLTVAKLEPKDIVIITDMNVDPHVLERLKAKYNSIKSSISQNDCANAISGSSITDILYYCHIFCTVYTIHGSFQFSHVFERELQKRYKKIFWYYSGHGAIKVRKKKSIGLLIPNNKIGILETYCAKELGNMIRNYSEHGEMFIILDCCHGSEMINPYSIPNVTIITSSSKKEAAGFFSDGSSIGSLFTYYFFDYIQRLGSNDLHKIRKEIEPKINHYRRKCLSKDQTISVSSRTGKIPKWIR